MSNKVDEILAFFNDSPAKALVERELKEIIPLFPNGDEEYLVVSVRYDSSNENLWTRTEGFQGFINFLHNFQLDGESFYEEFSFVAIKNDKKVYSYDSDYEQLDELFEDEENED
jgi:hypothetical protein